MRIFNDEPQDWHDLQNFVGRLFSEIGYEVEVSKVVELVRGKKEIDVFVIDNSGAYPTRFLIECKFWNKPVNQEVVHAFQTVIEAFGANFGFIVSKNGFQSGAFEAVNNTNINLVSLAELEKKFYAKWIKGMRRRYLPISDKLFPYWDPVGGKMPPDGKPISWEKQQLISEAYRPIIRLGPTDDFLFGFPRKYPMIIPVMDDDLNAVGKFSIKNDREYFDFVEANKDRALKHFKKLYRES